jgi:hypothetical protein
MRDHRRQRTCAKRNEQADCRARPAAGPDVKPRGATGPTPRPDARRHGRQAAWIPVAD